jgi:hypothetical protein
MRVGGWRRTIACRSEAADVSGRKPVAKEALGPRGRLAQLPSAGRTNPAFLNQSFALGREA